MFCRDPRLDAPRRPGLAPPAERRRPRRARGGDVRRRADPHGRARLLLHAALPGVPRRLRDLGGHRPAAGRDRDDGRAARSRSGRASRCCCGPAGAAAAGLAWPQQRERDRVQLRAALPRARRRRRRALLARGAHRSAGDVARRRLRLRPLPDRGLAQLAARDDRRALPPAHAPAPERAHRGRGAAARRAGADAADAGEGRPPRPRPAPRVVDPPHLARRVVPDAPRPVLRLGAAHRLGAEPRARDPHRRRASSSGGRSSAAASRRRRPSATSPSPSSARRSSASRTSSPAGRSTRSTSTRRGCGACRRCATRTSAGSS